MFKAAVILNALCYLLGGLNIYFYTLNGEPYSIMIGLLVIGIGLVCTFINIESYKARRGSRR